MPAPVANILRGSFEKKDEIGDLIVEAAGNHGVPEDGFEDDMSINGDSSVVEATDTNLSLNQILLTHQSISLGLLVLHGIAETLTWTVTHSCLRIQRLFLVLVGQHPLN